MSDTAMRLPTGCTCGNYHADPSGDSGCGNCGADYPPGDTAFVDALEAALGRHARATDDPEPVEARSGG